MSRSTRGIAARLAASTPGTGRRALEAAIGVVSTVRTIGAFRRPNPGEIHMVEQTDGTFAPAGSLLEETRAMLAAERKRTRQQFEQLASRTTGSVPDALEDEDDDDDDGIPSAR